MNDFTQTARKLSSHPLIGIESLRRVGDRREWTPDGPGYIFGERFVIWTM